MYKTKNEYLEAHGTKTLLDDFEPMNIITESNVSLMLCFI